MRLVGCRSNLLGGSRHTAYQAAQLFHRIVERVGDRTGDVFRHRGLHRQVAVRNLLKFVHQPQNRSLVLVVGGLGLFLLHLRLQPLRFRRFTPQIRFPRTIAALLQEHQRDARGG